MPTVRVKLDKVENKIVEMEKASSELSSKEEAIKQIIRKHDQDG